MDRLDFSALASRLQGAGLDARLGPEVLDEIASHIDFSRAHGMAEAMQAVRNAAAVFDGAGRLLCLNSLAQARAADLFDVADGALVFHDRASQSRFDAFLALALGAGRVDEPQPIAQSVRSRSRGSTVIRAIGLVTGGGDSSANVTVLLLFDDPEPAGEDIARLLIQAFGLTGAEARVAIEIGSGRSLAEAAETLGIGYETARTQVRAVFAKTDTRRQSQVATLIARLSRR